MIGSLKKGSKQSLSLPSTAYNTLPSQHHLRTTTSSPRFIQQGPSSAHSTHSSSAHHKRSPSSDSGHGTMHNTVPAPNAATSVSSGPASGGGGSGYAANVRSTTPVSYHGSTGAGGGGGSGGGRRSNNTVYLHGK